MDFQKTLNYLDELQKSKGSSDVNSGTSFDSVDKFLEGLQRPPVAPLTPQQAQSQFAQIPFQPSAQPAPQAPAPQGNAVQRAIAPAASFLDTTLGGLAPGIIEPVTYAGSRAFGATPEQATQSSQAAAAPFVDPFGKALGVSELPQYKGEASRQIMEFIGANMGKGAEYIAQQTGYPVADIQNMMGTLVAGGGAAAGKAFTGRGVSPAVTQMQDQYAASLKARQPRIEPTMTPEGAVTPETVAAVTPDTTAKLWSDYDASTKKIDNLKITYDKLINEEKFAEAYDFYDKNLSPLYEQSNALFDKANAATTTPVAPVAAAAMPEVPMATPAGEMVTSKAPGIEVSYIKPTPDVPKDTPFITSPLQENIAPNSTTTPRPTIDNPFVEAAYSKTGNLPIDEQIYRAETVKELGIPTIREGTITGDYFRSGDEYVTAKTVGPVRELYNNQIALEQQALRDYARGIVEKTGGSIGLDENSLYNRGQAIAQPFDDFKALLKQQINDSYKAANEVAQGKPIVETDAFQKLLKINSKFVRNDDFKALRNGAREYFKELGLRNKDGSFKPTTVEELERFKEYLNTDWNPNKSNIIAEIKNAIDDDVSKVAGEDIYKSSRALRIKLADLLENPSGVSKIMDYDPRTPINRTTAFPDIPTTVEKMTPDHQQHLIKVLQDMPPELQPQAQKAIAEIKSQFANRIAEVGGKGTDDWNALAVSKYLKDNNRSLRILTGDPQMARSLTVLNDGGHFLKMDKGYKGAAIQTANMFDNKLISNTLTLAGSALGGSIGASVGGALGGTTGAVIGGTTLSGAFGAAAQRSVQRRSTARAIKQAQKSLRPISEVLTSLQKKQ